MGAAGLSGVGDVVDVGGGAFDDGVEVVELLVDAGVEVDAEEEAAGVEVLAEAVHATGEGGEVGLGDSVVVIAVGPSSVEVNVTIAVVGEVGGEEGVDLGFDFFFCGLAAEEGPGAPAHVGFLSEFGVGCLSGG